MFQHILLTHYKHISCLVLEKPLSSKCDCRRDFIYYFSSFFSLTHFLPQISGLNLPLPPKKLIGNMDREFIAERQKGLQAYLNFLTQHHILSSCELVKKFLDTNNYSANYTGVYVENLGKQHMRSSRSFDYLLSV